MRSPSDVQADLDRLPWQKKSAIEEAVVHGRAVPDEALAPLAAEWAASRRRVTIRIAVLILAIVVPLAVWGAAGVSDPKPDLDLMLATGVVVSLVMALIGWAVVWRPSVRAERANRAVTGEGPPPRRGEPSHWVYAWLIAWPVGAIIGLGLRAAGITLGGPVGFVCWIALVWVLKRGLDSRQATDDDAARR